MSSELTIAPQADKDVDGAAAYIADRNLDAGLRFYGAVEETFSKIAAMPGIGAMRPTNNPALAGLRMFPVQGFKNYLIFYVTQELGHVRILRVLHGAQQVERIVDLSDA